LITNKLQKLRCFTSIINSNGISARASSCAFFIFLSFIPMLILIISILPLTTLGEETLVAGIVELVPDALSGMVADIVREVYTRSSAVISLSALLTLWSATKGVMALMDALNAINNIVDKRHFILKRLTACADTILLLFMFIVSLGIMVFGEAIEGFVQTRFNFFSGFLHLLIALRFILALPVHAAFFLILYRFLPGARLSWRKQIPGSLFTGIIWSVFSWGFSEYVARFKPYGMYGSLSGIIMTLLWLYFCLYIFLIGAVVNTLESKDCRAARP